jgi:hypothetical protein
MDVTTKDIVTISISVASLALSATFRGWCSSSTAVGRRFAVLENQELGWWAVAGSNCGPPACKAGALTG